MPENDLINHQLFHTAKTLMGSKFTRVLGYYFEDTESYISMIALGMQDNNIGQIVPAAHTIKSSSYQLGLLSLSQAAAKLEITGKEMISLNSDDFSALPMLIAQIQELYMLSKQQLIMLTAE